MKYSIEVCLKEDSAPFDKGKLLEDLTSKILCSQQYEVTQELRVTGMEIDVLAKHKINATEILVECKAWNDSLPADIISKLLGNVHLRNVSSGWLISTGPLSKDAKGVMNEWENQTRGDRSKLSFYTTDRIIQLLLDSQFIMNPITISESFRANFKFAENSILMISDVGLYWLFPILQTNANFITSIVVFDAKNGKRLTDMYQLNDLKLRKNSCSDYQWLYEDKPDGKLIKQVQDEYNSIVPVISGDDWKDYRPARPEDFVGRRRLLDDIYYFFDNVITNESEIRLFSIKAPSGMGKSSVVLKVASIARERKRRKKYFVYAVDVRTAMSPRYVEIALKACMDKADISGFTDIQNRKIDFVNLSQFFTNESIQKTLEYFRREKKIIVLIFDQFEELFSKKNLWGLFDNIRQLSNILDAQKQNFVIGFAWKTDLSIPAEHPAYYLWSNLSERRKEFDLAQFQTSEIESAIKIFSKQLGEPINPILGRYLSKQCQGYPWLLKKLCIHVFDLIKDGRSQDTIIGQKLNIVDLFEKDLTELNPNESACLKNVAENTPADYFQVIDAYGNDVLESLINKRLIIRRVTKLSLYWDIFNDYVINKTIPSIILDYIPQYAFTALVKVLIALLESDGLLYIQKICEKTGFQISTIDNLMIDLVMFGIAKRENGYIILTYNNERKIIEVLQNFFKNHIIYSNLILSRLSDFTYKEFTDIFIKIYSSKIINEKTKSVYAAKVFNWLKDLALIYVDGAIYKIGNPQVTDVDLYSPIRESNGLYGEKKVFFGQTSPEKMKKTYEKILKGENSYRLLKSQGLRNAIEVLLASGGIEKKGDTIDVKKSLEDIFIAIRNSSTIAMIENELKKNKYLRGFEAGEILNERFSRNWVATSKLRYGNAIVMWVKYFESLDKGNIYMEQDLPFDNY